MKKNQKITKKVKSTQGGITLIALVVTVIVLLILAGISISMLTGQNGILNRAEEAKEKTQAASDLEYLRTETYSALMSYYTSGTDLSEDEYVLQELAKLSGITTNLTTGTVTYNGKNYNINELMGNTDEQNQIASEGLTQVTDSSLITEDGKIRMVLEETTPTGEKIQAVIPAGFYYVTGKPSEGLVISDVQGDDDQNTKSGNQFVWVPCNKEYGITYEKEIANTNGLASTWKEKYSNYQYWYTTYTTTTTKEDGTTETVYNPIKGTWTDNGGDLASVQKYGGFYVARYEAGVPNEEFYSTTNNAEYVTNAKKNSNDVLSLSPVSKKNTFSWNYISQEKAVTVSENMYKESESVKSQLIDSYAWDTIVEWMQKNENGIATNSNNRGNYTNSTFSINNGIYALHRLENLTTEANKINAAIDKGTQTGTKYTTHGWKSIYKTGSTVLGVDTTITKEENDNYGFVNFDYRDQTYYYYNVYKEILTGSAEETEINNIYDMAGNMWEWTTETGNPDGTSTQRAVRRGGSFYNYGSSYPHSYRSGSATTAGYPIDIGFRVVLYIQ